MRARGALLLLLQAAVATAHEDLEAVWFQPLAPIAAGGAIIPAGFTHGLGPSSDLTVELTPYWQVGELGACLNGCRQRLLGLIATGGVTFPKPIISAADWELEWFWGPKLILAAANETGIAGYTGRDYAFVPGTSYEFGGGVDVGAQVHHRHSGWFVALVLGLQCTKPFNYGLYEDWLPNVPTSPVWLVREYSLEYRRNDGTPLIGLNLNLLRIGIVF
ncbi:MAG TPA: hypothetical protein VFA20_17950 [Myxococcaceae bacterium]|nr:hypothetical protein [Myxococcaceae bacterium]